MTVSGSPTTVMADSTMVSESPTTVRASSPTVSGSLTMVRGSSMLVSSAFPLVMEQRTDVAGDHALASPPEEVTAVSSRA